MRLYPGEEVSVRRQRRPRKREGAPGKVRPLKESAARQDNLTVVALSLEIKQLANAKREGR